MQLARAGGREVAAPAARALPRAGVYRPGAGVAGLDAAGPDAAGRPVVAVAFYRSMLLANDQAPVDALVAALEAEGLAALAVFVPSLRDADTLAALEPALARAGVAAIVTATAFAAGEEAGLFARLGVPVFQAVPATTRREAWEGGQRGLVPADLAMHVVLPELDGRILAGAVSFKETEPLDERLGLRLQRNRPEAGPGGAGGAAGGGGAAAGGDAGGGAAGRGAGAGLSGGGGAGGLCRGARRAGERARHPRGPARGGIRRGRGARRRRGR